MARAAGRREQPYRQSRLRLLAIAAAAFLLASTAAQATHRSPGTDGHTTLEQILAPSDPEAAEAGEYTTLETEAVDDSYLLRDPAGIAVRGREKRRRSLSYVSQLTDFQVADEESPARVEFLDPQAASAWRPQEAFHPFVVDGMVRQVNRFAAASPVPQGDGSGAAMDFSLITGDQADNQQHNETVWIRELLEGNGPLDFGAGSEDPATYTDPAVLARSGCTALLAQFGGDAGAAAAEAAGYTGVQDYDDYPGGGGNTAFYDPDDVQGQWATLGWPTYDGLMDHAQTHAFTPEGLDVPFYITNGNHDALVQGNEDSVRAIEDIALSCQKILATSADPSQSSLEAIFANPTAQMLVPPDDGRRHVSKPQIKEIYGATDPGDDDHGFGLVDPDELAASNGSASYYAWSPPEAPGFRYISIDTVSEGGVLGPFGPQPTGSSEGNIDDPQWRWLVGELREAKRARQKVILFGHHPIRTLTVFSPADEQASPCTTDDSHDHDVNPGCDLDPRSSEPLHLGEPGQRPPGNDTETLTELLEKHPNVLAYVAGHTHENDIRSYEREDGSMWWEIGTAAGADWPQQARLIEVMDNRDGTLSIFATILDPALPATAPGECATADCASSFDAGQLGAIGHTLAFNDPQISGEPRSIAEGDPEDRNAELLLRDPFTRGSEHPGCANPTRGTRGGDVLRGGPADDGINGGRGNDRIEGRKGNDCLRGARGADEIAGGAGDDLVSGGKGLDDMRGGKGEDQMRGGKGGDSIRGGGGGDSISGKKGRDVIRGGGGDDELRGGERRDRIRGGKGSDEINVRGGGVDVANCGGGVDLVIAGRRDRVRRNCERVRRPG